MVTSLSDTPLQMPTITVKPTDRQIAADQPAAAEKPRRGLFGPEGFSFSAFLDIINPLQHIPVVSTIYRAVTGDTIENGSRLIGGTLFGGPIGFIASAISGMIEESTGKDVGDHVLAFAGIDFGGQKATAPAQTGLAETGLAEATRAEGKPAQNAPTTTNAQNAQVSPNGSSLETILASGRGGLDDIVWTAPRFATPENPAIASTEPQQNAQRAREIPIGALSDLAQRAWGDNAQVASANPAASAPIRAGRPDQSSLGQSRLDQSGGNTVQVNAMPAALAAQAGQEKISGQIDAASNNTAAGNDGRQWYPAFPQQGGVATRSVGTQPVGPQNAAVKSGAARGVTYSQTGAASNQADLAERANAAYQKYLDLKERQSRERTLDQSF